MQLKLETIVRGSEAMDSISRSVAHGQWYYLLWGTLLHCASFVHDLYLYFWFNTRQKYYPPQVWSDQGSNSWLPDHDSTFHITEMPALTTWPSVTSRGREGWNLGYMTWPGYAGLVGLGLALGSTDGPCISMNLLTLRIANCKSKISRSDTLPTYWWISTYLPYPTPFPIPPGPGRF